MCPHSWFEAKSFPVSHILSLDTFGARLYKLDMEETPSSMDYLTAYIYNQPEPTEEENVTAEDVAQEIEMAKAKKVLWTSTFLFTLDMCCWHKIWEYESHLHGKCLHFISFMHRFP